VGRKLYAAYNVNRFPGDLADGVLNRLNTSFGVIGYGQNNFSSAYHGGTAAIRNRGFTRGLNFQAAYTFGKAIDLTSSFGPNLNVVDRADLRLQRGLSDFDIRHRLSFSVLYNFPRYGGGSGALGRLLNGWALGNVTILQSGTPISVRCQQSFVAVRDANNNIIGNSGCDYNLDGQNYDLPLSPAFGNSLTGLERADYISGIFTRADFPVPAFGQQGDLGRNTYRGPGFANTDLSFIKNTQIPWFMGKEGANLQFRAEFFNIFNRVNMGAVQGDMSNSQFGRSTGTFPARNIQFGFRITF